MKTTTRVALALTLIIPISTFAAPAPWKAGFATIKITPDIPLPMAGYDSRTKPFTNIEHNIYAKALALEDEQGQRKAEQQPPDRDAREARPFQEVVGVPGTDRRGDLLRPAGGPDRPCGVCHDPT